MNKESLRDEKKIELYHESIEEIMGTPPVSMVRVGSGILLMVILGLLTGSRFIAYPDMVQATALLHGDLPLSVQTFPEAGRIVNVSRYDNEWVNQGDTLFCVKSYTGVNYSIVAKTSGIIEFDPLLNIKQSVRENDTVAIIWGKETESVACMIRLSPDHGKNVKEGNKIRLRLDKYPSERYGVVETYVKSISHFNTEKDIQIIAELPGKIITSNQQEIFVKGNVYASAEIITGEQTIFNRLVNPFRGLIKE